jgi:hypothetical protein
MGRTALSFCIPQVVALISFVIMHIGPLTPGVFSKGYRGGGGWLADVLYKKKKKKIIIVRLILSDRELLLDSLMLE